MLFQPGAVQVNAVNPDLGGAVNPGVAVLQVTLTARQVQIALDASQQSDVAVGDKVSIVMPDNSTTPGVVSYVRRWPSRPLANNNGSGSGPPTVTSTSPPLTRRRPAPLTSFL